LCWLPSVLFRNYSFVDRLWSILPAYYAVLILLGFGESSAGLPSPRLSLLAMLITMWTLRLTYNFYRKGGYEWSGEDYRWAYVQETFRCIPSRGLQLLAWELFNLGFIALIQNVLLLALTLPVYLVWLIETQTGTGVATLNRWDALGTGLWLLLLLGETIADQQQWDFHQAKHHWTVRKSLPPHSPQGLVTDLENGFLTRGLFRLSRHPNFMCEMSLWWVLTLFVKGASQGLDSTAIPPFVKPWVYAPALALTLLFQGSTTLTENITASKYPLYREYQRTTARFVP
ncbi:hypothetical protein BJ085DRAFT_679, partial [Dimargaris cristalligena]